MSDSVLEVKDRQTAAQIARGVALVSVYDADCPECAEQRAVMEDLAPAFSGKAVIACVNADCHPEFADACGADTKPTLVLFVNAEARQQWTGLQKKTVLAQALHQAVGE